MIEEVIEAPGSDPIESFSTPSDPNNAPDSLLEMDGWYGWVIVLASFFVHVFVLGNVYSFGVFYPVYIDAFKSNQGSVAWVGSIGGCLMVGVGTWVWRLHDLLSTHSRFE